MASDAILVRRFVRVLPHSPLALAGSRHLRGQASKGLIKTRCAILLVVLNDGNIAVLAVGLALLAAVSHDLDVSGLLQNLKSAAGIANAVQYIRPVAVSTRGMCVGYLRPCIAVEIGDRLANGGIALLG